MRLLILIFLLAPCLHALDTKDVDGETLRDVRIALLKDKVRGHLGLRIGDFESLDQALRVKFDGAHLLCMRLGTKCAALIVRDGQAGAHLLVAVERSLSLKTFGDTRAIITCAVREEGPLRSRLIEMNDNALELQFTWTGAESTKLEEGRYVIAVNRELKASGEMLKLVETTTYLLDGEQVDGGRAVRTWPLIESDGQLTCGAVAEAPMSVTANCAIARELERGGFAEAALHHAQLAKMQADKDKLRADDARRLEAMSLATRLNARLRKADVVQK